MKYLLLFFLIMPWQTYARQLSDLYYLPTENKFIGSSMLSGSSTQLEVGSSLANVQLKSKEQFFKQLFGYGVTNWMTFAIETPFSLGGDTDVDVNGFTSSVSSDSGFLGLTFNFSVLFIDDTEKDLKLGMDLHYNPKDLNDREIGFMGLTVRGSGSFSKTTSWLISTSYLQYDKSETVKSFSLYGTQITLQHHFNEHVFIRPSLILNIETKTSPLDGSFEIHNDPRFGFGLSLGGYIGGPNVLWQLSVQHVRGHVEYFESGTNLSGEMNGSTFSGGIVYSF